MSGTSLAMRILDAVPAATHEMTALLGLLRIEESRDIPTAAVTCERRPVLKINPDFVAAALPQRRAPLPSRDARAPPRPARAHAPLPAPHAPPQHRVRRDDQRAPLRPLSRRGAPLVLPRLLRRARRARCGSSLRPRASRSRTPACARSTNALLYDGRRDAPTRCSSGSSRARRRRARARRWKAASSADHGEEGDDDWGTGGPLARRGGRGDPRIVEKWPPPPGATRGRSLADLLEKRDDRGRRRRASACSPPCAARSRAPAPTGAAPRAVRRPGRSRLSSRFPVGARPPRRRGAPLGRRAAPLRGRDRSRRRARPPAGLRLPRRQREHGARTCRLLYGALVRSREQRRAPRPALLDEGRHRAGSSALAREGRRRPAAAPREPASSSTPWPGACERILFITDGYVGRRSGSLVRRPKVPARRPRPPDAGRVAARSRPGRVPLVRLPELLDTERRSA